MNRLFALGAILLGIGLAWPCARADGILKRHHAKPACEPGFKLVEEIVYQDVVKTVCKMVPETKKKWVYSWIDDPFCVQDTKHGRCPQCSGPYCRKLLVKRQIDEPCPTMKCVTEQVVERVPVVTYKKVPIGPAPEQIPVAPKRLPAEK